MFTFLNDLLATYPNPMSLKEFQGLVGGTLTELKGNISSGLLQATQIGGAWSVSREDAGTFIGAHQHHAEATSAVNTVVIDPISNLFTKVRHP